MYFFKIHGYTKDKDERDSVTRFWTSVLFSLIIFPRVPNNSHIAPLQFLLGIVAKIFAFQTGSPVSVTHTYSRRKIRLIEGNAKCRHLKNLPVSGLWDRFLCV
jgi:hypothetical protein